jgi:hypothetical protein
MGLAMGLEEHEVTEETVSIIVHSQSSVKGPAYF